MSNYKIRPLQERIINNLLTIHQICERHGLRYYLWAGTMLGAVRHKGCIPWDDDIDIAMPRNDYDTLIANASIWLPKQYEIVSFETDPENYPLPFAKLQDASTTLIEREHLHYLGGVYIDIFPLDGITSNIIIQRLHFLRYQWYKKALYFVHRDPYRHGHGISAWLPLICRRIFTLQQVQEELRTLQKTYNYDKCELVVDHDDGFKGIMPKSIIGDPTLIEFEGYKLYGVANTHSYLELKYGDYMTIPPLSHQNQHNFHYLNLTNSYKNFSNE